MSTLLCRCFIGAYFLVTLVPLVAATKDLFPGQNEKWRYCQSPNFEVYSGNSERETRDLLYKMEVLRAIFLEKNKLKEKRPVPITVYYFGKDATFQNYSSAAYKKGSFAGFYLAGSDRSVITMAPREDEDRAQTVIFHEYIHHLMNVTEQKPPPWYNEGMAELFSTIKIEGNEVELGHPAYGRVFELQQNSLLPLEQLFGTTHASAVFTQGKHTGMFYAQSWGLLHLCYFGMSDLPREKLDVFLRIARAPKYSDPQLVKDACQELLGMDYVRLNRELTNYVRSGRYRFGKFPIPKVDDPKTYVMRPVSVEEITDRLAELELRVNRTGKAGLAMLQAAERNPTDPRPYEVLAGQSKRDGDLDMARERWNKALALGSENPTVFFELGQMESRRWFSQFSLTFRLPDDVAVRLRELLLRSIQAAPGQSVAYEMLAWVEATANESQVANINLVQKHIGDLTDKRRTLLATALVLWRRGDEKNSLLFLDQLAKEEPDSWVQWGAETLRAKIEKRRPVRPESTGTKSLNPSIQVKIKRPVKIKVPVKE